MSQVYLASPLGFSQENKAYSDKIKAKLASQGLEVFDPWEQIQFQEKIDRAFTIETFTARLAAFREVASEIGQCNEEGIRSSDLLLAVLDGAEVDSGTASEVGFASALGKTCFGLRTDVRDCGDFLGVAVNLQVLHFIERTGGRVFRSIEEIYLCGAGEEAVRKGTGNLPTGFCDAKCPTDRQGRALSALLAEREEGR